MKDISLLIGLRLLHTLVSFSAGYGLGERVDCCDNHVRSEKLQNESSPNFSNFRPGVCPEFCSEFSPIFSWIFRALFRGKRRPEKIHQKSPPFFNAKFPGKHEENIHKKVSGEQAKLIIMQPVPKRQTSGRVLISVAWETHKSTNFLLEWRQHSWGNAS